MPDPIWLVELVNGPRDGHEYRLAETGHGTPETFGRDEAGRWLVKAYHAGKALVP